MLKNLANECSSHIAAQQNLPLVHFQTVFPLLNDLLFFFFCTHLELATPASTGGSLDNLVYRRGSVHQRHISLYYPSNNCTEQSPLCLSCLLRMRDYCIQRSNSFVLLQRLAVTLREEVMFNDSLFHLTFTFNQGVQSACLFWSDWRPNCCFNDFHFFFSHCVCLALVSARHVSRQELVQQLWFVSAAAPLTLFDRFSRKVNSLHNSHLLSYK